MQALLGMPQGSEWIIILAIVVLLFGSAKLPGLVRSLGQSKKAWDDEVGKKEKEKAGELTKDASTEPAAQPQQPVQQAQPQAQQAQQAQQPNTQVNGHNPGDGTPPTPNN